MPSIVKRMARGKVVYGVRARRKGQPLLTATFERLTQDLITCELPFIMPAVKRGKKLTTPGGPTGTYTLAAHKQSHWTTYTLEEFQRRPGYL